MKHLFSFLCFVVFFFVCQSIFLAHYFVIKNGIWGDGRYYYVILRSAVVDHDLDFHNESVVNPFAFEQIETPTGKIFNKYSVGAPLLWSPFFLMAHELALILHGPHFPPDGYGHPYRIFVGIGAVTYGWAGIFLIFLALKKQFSQQIALLSSMLVAIGTHAFFYIAVDPVNSHSASIFLAGLFFYLISSWWKKPRFILTVFLGVTCGALALVRMQDSLFWLGIAWLIIRQSQLSRPQKVMHLITSAGITFLVFTPQLAEWQYLLGSIQSPYSFIGETFTPLQPHLIEVLFSFNNGLFVWSPLLLFSLVGLWISRRHIFSQIGLVLWAAETYAVASWHGWWGGASFGGRMFLTLLPFFIWGVAQALQKWKFLTRWPNYLALFLTAGIANVGAIVLFLLWQ